MRANPATSIVCVPFLSAEECDALLASLAEKDWSPGRIAHPESAAQVEQVIRSCGLNQHIPVSWMQRIEETVLEYNRTHFRFDVQGPLREQDPVCAMRYEPGDHFVWHIDNAVANTPSGSRKLSFSVQLSDPDDYDGGDLEFAMYSPEYGEQAFAGQRLAARRRGSLILFPAFHLHRISPVTRGVRVAIVGWLHGPAFR